MSHSGAVFQLPEDPWYVVLHDIKVELNPAIALLEGMLSQERPVITGSQLYPVLFELLQILDESKGSLQTKKEQEEKEPLNDQMKQAQLIQYQAKLQHYKEKLRACATQVQALLKIQREITNTAVSEEDPLAIVALAINNTLGVIDPAFPRSPMTLGQLIHSKKSHHKSVLDKNNSEVQIRFNPPELENVLLQGNRVNLIKSIVGNCIENASAKARKIDVLVQQTRGDSFDLIIRDNGPGMPPHILAGIREGRVVTTGGNGIGLSGLSAKISAIEGAQLTVDSNPGQGAQFTWKFPSATFLTFQAPETPRSALTATSPMSTSTLHDEPFVIYYIDDNAINRKIIKKTIESALTAFKEESKNPLLNPLLDKLKIETAVTPDYFTAEHFDENALKRIVGIITDINLGLDRERTGITEAVVLKDKIHDYAIIYTYSGEDKEAVAEMVKEIKDYPEDVLSGHIVKGKLVADSVKDFLAKVLENVLIPEASQSNALRIIIPAIAQSSLSLSPNSPSSTSTQVGTSMELSPKSSSSPPRRSTIDPSSPVHAKNSNKSPPPMTDEVASDPGLKRAKKP